MPTNEADFAFMATFHPNSPQEVVSVGVASFRFSFLTFLEIVMEIALFSCKNSGMNIYSDRNLSDVG